MTGRDSEYLHFELTSSGKTKKWAVISKKHNERLGTIKWYGAWFQYAFFPGADTIWNVDCLGAIESFMEQETEAWRRGR
jgi:hypothetical protein